MVERSGFFFFLFRSTFEMHNKNLMNLNQSTNHHSNHGEVQWTERIRKIENFWSAIAVHYNGLLAWRFFATHILFIVRGGEKKKIRAPLPHHADISEYFSIENQFNRLSQSKIRNFFSIFSRKKLF